MIPIRKNKFVLYITISFMVFGTIGVKAVNEPPVRTGDWRLLY